MSRPARTVALIAAAGRGARLGAAVNKVYVEVAGAPILAWAVAGLRSCPLVQGFVIVTGAEDLARAERIAEMMGVECQVVAGGQTRAASVRAGLEVIRDAGYELVAVHDGARPFVSPDLVMRTVDLAAGRGAAGAALPVSDTIKVVDADCRVIGTPGRGALWAMQTPQTFRAEWLLDAYDSAGDAADAMTDDCEVVERSGRPVFLCVGERENIKVTYEEDLRIAEAIAARREGPAPVAVRGGL